MPLNGKFLDKNGLTYLWSKLKALFSSKQDTISDLGTIRSGAEAGATAVQPATLAAETSAREAADSEMQSALIRQVDAGAKNLLRNIRETTTHKGITFTVASDGTVTASGTNDGTGASLLNINTQSNVALPDGNYVISGCPQGGSTTGYLLDVTRSGGSSIKDTGNGAEFEVGGDYTVNEFRIIISRGISVDNVVFKPMICTAADYTISPAFVPYAPTNRELYEMILALQSGGSSTQSTAALLSAMPGKSAEITTEDEPEESEM